MKILYHHRTASRDGQAVHIDELIGALRARGHEVRIVCPGQSASSSTSSFASQPEGSSSTQGHGQNGQSKPEEKPSGAQGGSSFASMGTRVDWVHRLKDALPKGVYEGLELAYSGVAYRRLARAIQTFKPDVIYERYNLFMLGGIAAMRRFKVPLLLEVNAPLVHERSEFGGMAMPELGRWAEGVAWSGADFVLPVTRVLADHVVKAGVPADRIVVIPNGINKAHFANAPTREDAKKQLGLPVTEDTLVLGFTGFVRTWHRVDRVIQWLAEKKPARNLHLVIVGDGPALEELKNLTAKLEVRSQVTFTGAVARALVPTYVSAFDIALQPAVVPYASPLKLFEYLALGKTIVAPRQPNIEEILTHDGNALLFDPDGPRELENALDKLVSSRDLRDRLADAARRTIKDRALGWDDHALQIEELAKTAISARAARRRS